jgi:Ca2+-transporting ATPase
MVIMVIILTAQILIIEFGGYVFKVAPMTPYMWAASVIIGSVTLPIGVVIRLLPTWDGCSVFGREWAVPDNSRVVMTKERLQWHHTIGQVRTQLSVFQALRGTGRYSSMSQDLVGSETPRSRNSVDFGSHSR